MAVRNLEAVQQLSGSAVRAESRPGRIGPISLGAKQTGERRAGNPHAAAFAPFLKRYPGEPGHSFSVLASASHRDSQLSAETHFNGKTWELLDEL